MVEDNCWQALLQSDDFLSWDKKEQTSLYNLFRYEGRSEDISLSDVFPTIPDDATIVSELISSPIGMSEYVDKRIRTLKFYNFRFFNVPIDDIPYGVDFTRKGNACSAFFVGGNGTGKSSVYSALELHYTGFCSHAKEMDCDIRDYLTFGFNKLESIQSKDVFLGIRRQDIKEEIRMSLETIISICPSCSFCSDYDIEQLRQNGKSLYLYVLRQLGFGQFERVLQHIASLQKTIENIEKTIDNSDTELTSAEFGVVALNYFDSAKKTRKRAEECLIYSETDKIRKKIEGLSTMLNPQLFKEQWNIVKKSKDTTSNSSSAGLVLKQNPKDSDEYNKQVESLAKLYQELYKIFNESDELRKQPTYRDEPTLLLTIAKNLVEKKQKLETENFQYIVDGATKGDIESKKGTLEKIQNTIWNIQHQIVIQFCQIFQREISKILGEFSDNDEKFQFDVKSNSINLNIKVSTKEDIKVQNFKSEDNSFPATPNEYLNSFRFKLFCITLKATMAFYWMLKNKTIVPFVIDDVFNANDFNNGLKLESFVYEVFRWYRQKLCVEGQCNIPLQLIMFTHDDMMQTAFKKGFIRSMAIECKEQMIDLASVSDQLICTRLFPKDAVEKVMCGKKMEYKNLYLYGA